MAFYSIAFVIGIAALTFNSCAAVQEYNEDPNNYAYSKPQDYRVSVNSFAEANSFLKKRYMLLSGTTTVRESDLEFKEYSFAIEKILGNQGMSRVASLDSADVAVFVTYGVGDPQKIEFSYTVPNFGVKEIRSISYGSSVSNKNGFSTFTGRTNYYFDYGVIGHSSETRSETVYAKYLGLTAIDIATLRKEKSMNQSWKISSVSFDKINDLRMLFPVLALSLEPYLLVNSDQYANVSIDKYDPKIEAIRQYVQSKREILLQDELEQKAKSMINQSN